MTTDTKRVSMRSRGKEIPSGTSRVVTAKRSVVDTADQCGRNGTPAKKVMHGGGDGIENPIKRNLRKFDHVRSTISEFMKKGISEPRRFRSLQVPEQVRIPFGNRNKRYSHVRSTVREFMKTGIREPRKFRSLPTAEEVRMPFIVTNNKYSHVSSSVRKFLKTGIREPRRIKPLPVVEKPVKIQNKKYAHIKSRVAVYIKYSMEEYLMAGRKQEIPVKKQPLGKPLGKPVLESPTTVKINGPLYDTEIDLNIIATLEKRLRAINKEQPTEAKTSEDISKFPNYVTLINSDDPFDLLVALGLGYHHKFSIDFGE